MKTEIVPDNQPNHHPPTAIILLSGGLDSATVLAIAKQQGFHCIALSFDYGQRHRWELNASKQVAGVFQVERHVIMPIDLSLFGGSALTDNTISVPEMHDQAQIAHRATDESTIPITYVPARNTVFLSLALAFAETCNACDLFIGINAVDYSGYPDCRPEFVRAFEQLANLATKAGVEGTRFHIHTPLINMTKAEIIKTGTQLGINYAITHSCYNPDTASGGACGKCESCVLRQKGFEDAEIPDPTRYHTKPV